jgi:hypothetical protein
MDGDLHLALKMRLETKRALFVCENTGEAAMVVRFAITVFSWTTTSSRFTASSDRKTKIDRSADSLRVTGKAYWDVGHAPKDQSNRRSHLPGYYAAWEKFIR